MKWALFYVAAYLIGSIPFSYLVVKVRTGKDVRTIGSGNVGGTNAIRAAGKAAGVLAGLLDACKGVAAVFAARAFDAPPPVTGGVAFAAVLGHCYPLFLRFRGGKGGATGGGALLVLVPPAALLSILVAAWMIFWKRYVSLGTVTAAAVSPLFVLLFQRLGTLPDDRWLLLTTIAIAALIVIRHHGNLRRLQVGTERRIGDSYTAG